MSFCFVFKSIGGTQCCKSAYLVCIYSCQ